MSLALYRHGFCLFLFWFAPSSGDGPPASALNLTEPSANQSDMANFTLDETNSEALAATNEQEKQNGYMRIHGRDCRGL